MCSQTQDKAPDGGWGWVIVAASFASHFLAYGSPQSVGVLYPEWLATFHEGKGLTAWVGSVTWGAGLIARRKTAIQVPYAAPVWLISAPVP
ncbi:hypothetical protein ANANG_G00306890 [Anguilla anguilla]|uniref:Major facilitator superfamily (MFS) profile domain-containing protein n=1 Tax=Anguilla anguilla TaxID=7936 RepID=A0A9D3RIR7_ANGAN|nr:hypothetical protein ANANG_G00306890 [Anguilla anguilla]